MATNRLYRTEVYKKTTTATVTAVKEKNGRLEVICDQTIFFPTGGGQTSDTGFIDDYKVIEAYDNDLEGDVIHIVDAPRSAIKAGDHVTLSINWDFRFDNMQRHLGEHILSGSIYRLFGGSNKGFHMGDECITIDIDIAPKNFTDKMLKEAELEANRVIWSDSPVVTTVCDNAKEASALPVRKKIDIEGKITVVSVGDLNAPYDCCACCGTHPSTSGQVGLIKIYKAESNKGMTRIFFDAGKRALLKCDESLTLLAKITDHFSSGTDSILHTLEVHDQKNAALKESLSILSKYTREKELDSILSDVKRAFISDKDSVEKKSDGKISFAKHISVLDANESVKLGFAINDSLGEIGLCDVLSLLICDKEKTILLFANGSYDCGKLVKDYAKECNGKGGGRKDNARAIFENKDDIEKFISLIDSNIIIF